MAFAFIAGGILLALLGVSAMSASSADPSRFLGNASPDRTVWILLGGVALFLSGVGALFPAFRRRED